ncbi:hypothetical protein IW140_005176 [Coemansia sp. RSA 1813]|nr:hypothetical protein EV178_003765 [Coemansia sp. RSA 1646]KAJ1769719.1 hypothetical protein LPJ74_003808 [Coemansia sp. RSA 1843]KAJ2089032.1 hypothetical protein IW138_003744 [Coemansia sp. RSA 986]KAJ2213475.1 hypothetical protein EV179_003794 [Coemansia sp. RSA 487]KAJ2565834.1 hypothetical protein IW140_005176 [Coemansia sp. RSA 1813]
MDRTKHELTVEERKWAARQVALVVGATEEDAMPLADFLIGVENPNELQSQLLDMLGESPLALDFSSELIAKRFPPVKQGPAPPLPPRNAQKGKESRPQSQRSARGAPHLEEPLASGMVAYRKPDPSDISYFSGVGKSNQGNTSDKEANQSDEHNTLADEKPAEQKSLRQIKKDRQQLLRKQREEEKKRQERAKRKRVKCECQASEHPLLTNCLTCGRIICDSEGPGPCMFCRSEVESPDQQLQQHMRRLLRHSEQDEEADSKKQQSMSKPQTPQKPTKKGMLYSMKAGGGMNTPEAGLLWDTTLDNSSADLSSDKPDTNSEAFSRGEELSEEEYLQLAFKALGIDDETTDPTALQEAESWVKATRRKERLLDYDRTAAQRTKLIDQLSDFDPFAVGRWMSPEEKIEAEKRKAAQIREKEEREARLRSGMRVLRLNFQSGSVDFKRPDESDDLELSSSSTNSARDHKTKRLSDSKGKTGSNGPWKTSATSNAQLPPPSPRPAAKQEVLNPSGSFANNPLLGDKAAPKFVLTPEKANAAKLGKKPKAKAKGKGKDMEKKDTEEPEPTSTAASLSNETSGKEPLETKSKDMEKRRQMLRIQTDADDELFF